MCRVLRLGITAGSSPDRSGLVGPGCGCIRRSIAPHRTGNHGEVMSARQAPLVGGLRWHGRLRPVRRASLFDRQRGCSGLRHAPAGGHVGARGYAATGPMWPAAVAGGWFPADRAQDDHADEQAGSTAGRRDGMAGPPTRRHLNGIRVVSRSGSWFDRGGLSLGGGSMRTGISPLFESCLSPDNVSLCIASWDFAPEQGRAWRGSR
jgi:hypothetical protein